MATIELASILLGPADDLASQIELDVSALDEDDAVDGAVRTYAANRRRPVKTATTSRALPLAFEIVQDRELLDLVRSWKGRTLLYRDPLGRKVWCVFFALQVKERIVVDIAEVSLTLTEVTFDEAV